MLLMKHIAADLGSNSARRPAPRGAPRARTSAREQPCIAAGRDIDLREAEFVALENREARRFAAWVVVAVEVVEADDLIAALEQGLGGMEIR